MGRHVWNPAADDDNYRMGLATWAVHMNKIKLTIDGLKIADCIYSFVADAKPMKDNNYMVQLAKVVVKRTILACK